MHEDDYRLQDEMRDPIAFQASSDPDTMYWGQAMNEPDAEQFQNAAIKEFNDHSIRNHWELIERINPLRSRYSPREERDRPAAAGGRADHLKTNTPGKSGSALSLLF